MTIILTYIGNNTLLYIQDKFPNLRLFLNSTEPLLTPDILLDKFEKPQTELVLNNIKDGDTFFDIGANIGWFSLNVLAHKKDVNVYAFEPVPDLYRLLNKNLHANFGMKDLETKSSFQTYIMAVSDEDRDEVPFRIVHDDIAASRLITKKEEEEMGMKSLKTVLTRKLDSIYKYFYFNMKKPIDFIKIDVEGFEYNVWKGMKEEVIKNNKNLKLFIEIHNYAAREQNKLLFKELREEGFTIQKLNEEGLEIQEEDKDRFFILASRGYVS